MNTRAQLWAIFRASAPDALDGSADDALEPALCAYVEAAQKAWRDFGIEDADLVRHVATRTTPGKLPAVTYAGDLLLACACARGVPSAIGAFRQRYGSVIARVLSRRRSAADVADDATQAVYERLLVAPGGGLPKIAEYKGSGPLRSWVSTATATTLLMINRAAGRRREEQEDSGIDLLTSVDPEILYMKARYKVEIQGAVAKVLARLTDRERTLLRLHLSERTSIDEVGGIYGVSRATAARWLAAARESLAAGTRDELRARLRLSQSECDSIVALVRSDLDLSISPRL